jgi:hypothetical protein
MKFVACLGVLLFVGLAQVDHADAQESLRILGSGQSQDPVVQTVDVSGPPQTTVAPVVGPGQPTDPSLPPMNHFPHTPAHPQSSGCCDPCYNPCHDPCAPHVQCVIICWESGARRPIFGGGRQRLMGGRRCAR